MLANTRRIYALADYTVEGRNRQWFFWRTARFGEKEEKRGPYSSVASVTLMLARAMKRKSPNAIPSTNSRTERGRLAPRREPSTLKRDERGRGERRGSTASKPAPTMTVYVLSIAVPFVGRLFVVALIAARTDNATKIAPQKRNATPPAITSTTPNVNWFGACPAV